MMFPARRLDAVPVAVDTGSGTELDGREVGSARDGHATPRVDRAAGGV